MNTNVREDLEDVIWELDPMDTWCLSNFDKGKADNVYHEWLTDTLAGATANRQLEGDDTSFATAAGAKRVGNYCQISKKSFLVSGTLEAVKKAGRKSEVARLATKYMKELKRDMEQAICTNQGSSAGSAVTVRSSAGIESWLSTNVQLSTTTANNHSTPGWSAGVVASPTDGATTAALTEGALKSALEKSWTQGGDPTTILVGATQKKVIDAFTGIATRFVDSSPRKEAAIIGAANMYVSGFGSPHMVVLSRYVRSSVVLCLDPSYWSINFLRKPFVEDLAKTGDGTKKHMITEFTLVARNEAASAKVVACA
jgi:hypothetical protein